MEKAREAWYSVNDKYPQELATVADLVDHIDHIVNLIGVDYVGIGTDFDGGGSLDDLRDVTQLGNITLELVKTGIQQRRYRKDMGRKFYESIQGS
jgi:membrane dipeptidase